MVRSIVVVLLLAGCRLHFDAGDVPDGAIGGESDAAPDADPITARCGPGVIVCDDFESDAFDPWSSLTDGGLIAVMPACGSSGSRCARATANTATLNARFAYDITQPVSTIAATGIVTTRSAISGEAQLIAIDFLDDAGVLATQLGISIRGGFLNLYEHDFVTTLSNRVTSTTSPTTDVPMKLSLTVDHGMKWAKLYLDDVFLVGVMLTSDFSVSNGSTVLFGLWVSVPVVTVDFDDVEVR